MTKKEVFELLKIVIDFYPREKVWQEKLDAWYDTLKNCDYQASLSKLKQYVQDNKYPPTIADVYVKSRPENPYDKLHEKIEEWQENAATPEEISAIVANVKWGETVE